MDQASASAQYPGLDLEQTKQLMKTWGVLDEQAAIEIFAVANQDDEDFSDEETIQTTASPAQIAKKQTMRKLMTL